MVTRVERRPLPVWLAAGLLLAAALVVPPLRSLGEASMARQMLVQMPLIVLAGWWMGAAWRRAPQASAAGRARSFVDSFNAGGATGLVIASFTMLLWMLPRSVDAARLDLGWDALKFATLALGLGAAAAISWPRCPPIARAVIHVEVIATFVRFGWGYAASDERLCAAYLQGDQRHAGTLLVVAGLVWAIAVAWRPLFGRVVAPGRVTSRGRVAAPGCVPVTDATSAGDRTRPATR